MMESFRNLGLSDDTLNVLNRKGFEEPSPIQQKTIPAILKGSKDIIGQAQTGTGKTAAFGLPIIELIEDDKKIVQALILTPTRELAIQVSEEIFSLIGKKKLSVIPIYGGQAMEIQLRSLKRGVDIVVGTPGRILDHLRRRTLKVDKISHLVLDEADEMLNMGFLEEVSEILDQTNPDKRTMLFSATMPKGILHIAKKYMGDYDVIKVTPKTLTVSQTDQIYFEVREADKFEALCRIIDIEESFYGLIFCRTKIDVDKISNHLMERGYAADGLHGDLSQIQREKILGKLRKRLLNVLVATDVAARGIDVQDLTHVINYALPQDPDSYVHRIGRTGRAGKEGIAITFITPEEYRKLQYIRKQANTTIRKGTLPGINEVISSKKNRIKSELEEIINTTLKKQYLNMSRDMLRSNHPDEILGALLQYSFQDELDEKSYAEIRDTEIDRRGTTRLFIKQGRRDGLTPKKIVKLITTKCDIKSHKVKDIEILDKVSFVTLPFHEAEVLLAYFKKHKKNAGPFIAKVDKWKKKGGKKKK